MSARSVAAELNARQVKTPNGAPWSPKTASGRVGGWQSETAKQSLDGWNRAPPSVTACSAYGCSVTARIRWRRARCSAGLKGRAADAYGCYMALPGTRWGRVRLARWSAWVWA